MTAPAEHHEGDTMMTTIHGTQQVTDSDLIAKAADLGIIISPGAITAGAAKLLKKSGIYSPNEAQLATARRGALEAYLLDVRASRKAAS
jgi:hypothetical protein